MQQLHSNLFENKTRDEKIKYYQKYNINKYVFFKIVSLISLKFN